MSTLFNLNYTLFQAINVQAGEHSWLDTLMIFCANWLIFCWPLVLLVLWGKPFPWRKYPVPSGEEVIVRERRAVVLWIAIACLLAYAFNLLIEQFVFEPRPFVTHKVHLLIQHAADSSFPSDHTAWSFAVFGMLVFALLPVVLAVWRKRSNRDELHPMVFFWPPLLTVLAFVIACSIGFARIFVGVHYPGDVLGGAVDGLLAASVITWIRRWLRRPTDAVLLFARRLRLA
jgi:undecaprenyl-diphosphatase